MTLEKMRKPQKAILMFKIVNGLTPPYLCEMFTHSASFLDYGLRSSKMNLALPKSRTDFYKNSFAFTGAKIYQFRGRKFTEKSFILSAPAKQVPEN